MPTLSSTILSWIEYEKQFYQIRTQLLKQQTNVEQQVQDRISSITDQSDEEQTKDKHNPNKAQQKQDKWNKCLIIHYTHEQRLASYKRDIHQIWDATFKPTPIQETKLIVGNRNNRNSAEELVSKRPNMPKALAKPHT